MDTTPLKKLCERTQPVRSRLSYNMLCTAINEAWETVPESFLEKQLNKMQERCLAVIPPEDAQTKY